MQVQSARASVAAGNPQLPFTTPQKIGIGLVLAGAVGMAALGILFATGQIKATLAGRLGMLAGPCALFLTGALLKIFCTAVPTAQPQAPGHLNVPPVPVGQPAALLLQSTPAPLAVPPEQPLTPAAAVVVEPKRPQTAAEAIEAIRQAYEQTSAPNGSVDIRTLADIVTRLPSTERLVLAKQLNDFAFPRDQARLVQQPGVPVDFLLELMRDPAIWMEQMVMEDGYVTPSSIAPSTGELIKAIFISLPDEARAFEAELLLLDKWPHTRIQGMAQIGHHAAPWVASRRPGADAEMTAWGPSGRSLILTRLVEKAFESGYPAPSAVEGKTIQERLIAGNPNNLISSDTAAQLLKVIPTYLVTRTAQKIALISVLRLIDAKILDPVVVALQDFEEEEWQHRGLIEEALTSLATGTAQALRDKLTLNKSTCISQTQA